MILNMSLLIIGWFLELVGILIIVSNSSRLSNWIFDNWLVTKDEVDDVNNLDMKLSVNGTCYQNGNTKTMIFKPAFIVSYLSKFMTLKAGDIISTGTPPGVGMGQSPEVFLNVGDEITLSIQGLGSQTQRVIAEG